MNPITRQMTMVHLRVAGYTRNVFDRMRSDDRGQGTLEYVGIAVAILVFVGVVATFLKTGMASTLQSKLTDAINSIGSDGPAPAATP